MARRYRGLSTRRKKRCRKVTHHPRRPGDPKQMTRQLNVRLPEWLHYMAYQALRRYHESFPTINTRARYLLERDARIVLGLDLPERLRQGLPPEDDPLTDYQI